MTLLHVYFALRNQQAFQRLLDGSSRVNQSNPSSAGGLSISAGKSWGKSTSLLTASEASPNARDTYGRTVLHIACASTEPWSLEFVRILLAQPAINVNVVDEESHWTPLHRALYHGNIAAAMLLLQRSDTDIHIKDLEGYTAFDLYNSTLNTTKPDSSTPGSRRELFTWGANRNAALGHSDGDDRAFPDQVSIPPKERDIDENTQKALPLDERFLPINAKGVAMSRLHTAVITSESRGNLRLCGFGSGGRLGPGQHTQYSLIPLQGLTATVTSIAAAQDHTLVLTSSGEVFSWGFNRFAQLGYVIEGPDSTNPGKGGGGEPIQSTPRKISGVLKKLVVCGVAACRTASVCWTEDEVFTWGTNSGQLGYDHTSQPVQILPRKVTKIAMPAIAVTITDSAMACLLVNKDVICIWDDKHFKINFPSQAFPQEMSVYRPPQAVRDANIAKITSCDDTFAALSSNGELFIFTIPKPYEVDTTAARGDRTVTVKPQRVWALRKQFSAVKDVAVGSDGSLVICTESGHVFVRTRNLKSGQSAGGTKTFKFQKMPYIQRVTDVCANSTGAFGAIRAEFTPRRIPDPTTTLAQDLKGVLPCLVWNVVERWRKATVKDDETTGTGNASFVGAPQGGLDAVTGDHEDDGDDALIQKDLSSLARLLDILARDKVLRGKINKSGLYHGRSPAFDADLLVQGKGEFEFPAHRLVLAVRSQALLQLLSSFSKSSALSDRASQISITYSRPANKTLPRLLFNGCHPLSVLIFVSYLYSDELIAIWDRRVSMPFADTLAGMKISPAQVKSELQVLAKLLSLPALVQALEAQSKRQPVSTLHADIRRWYEDTCFGAEGEQRSVTSRTTGTSEGQPSPLAPDVVLQLVDRNVPCHSVILRARAPFFAAFFDEPVWTYERRDAHGVVHIDMRHLRWSSVQFVMRYLVCGEEVELLRTIDFVNSVDEMLEFLFEVMAVANELLLDELILLISATILRHINISNACYILAEATHLNATALVESVQEYIAANIELLLQSRMLDDLPPRLIKQLSAFIRAQQQEKSPISRSFILVDIAMAKHYDWLQLQDFAQPLIRTARPKSPKKSRLLLSASTSATAGATASQGTDTDDIFEMEAEAPLAQVSITPPAAVSSPLRQGSATSTVQQQQSPIAWQAKTTTPKADMKAIMAEAEGSKRSPGKTTASGSILSQQRPLQHSVSKEWRKTSWTPLTLGEQQRDGPSTPTRSTPSASGTPWRTTSAATTLTSNAPPTTPPRPSLNMTPIGTPSSSTTPIRQPSGGILSDGKPAGPSAPARQPSTSTNRAQPDPKMGPTITPSRRMPSSQAGASAARITSSKSASPWVPPPVEPTVGAATTASNAPLSFAEIQQSQADQGSNVSRDKRSLLEIQQEERDLQAEVDFMKWWTAEEERIRLENEQMATLLQTGTSSPKKAQHKKHNKPSKSRAKDLGVEKVHQSKEATVVTSQASAGQQTSSSRTQQQEQRQNQQRQKQQPRPQQGEAKSRRTHKPKSSQGSSVVHSTPGQSPS